MEGTRERTDGAAMSLISSSPELLQQRFKTLIPFVNIQMRVCGLLSCTPFEWNAEEQQISVVKSKKRLFLCKATLVVHTIYTLIMTGYFVSPYSAKLNKISTRLLGFLFLSCLVVTMLMNTEIFRKRRTVVALWNSYLDIEQKYMDVSVIKKAKKDKMSMLLMLLGICTSFGLPGFMCTMLIVDPCKPPHLGYILYKIGFEQCVKPPIPVRICLLLFDGWVWFISIAPACFYVFHNMFLGLRCLDLYLQLLMQGVKKRKHFREAILRTQHSKDVTMFKLYNEYQMIIKFYNLVFQAVFLPSLIATAIFVIVICLFTCIKLHKVIPMPGFAFFPLLSSDGFSVIFIAKIASIVYIKSKKFVLYVRKSSKYTRKTWYRKMARTLDMMKIQFGSGNFIDELTPLVFLDFSFSQTVSLMLLTEK